MAKGDELVIHEIYASIQGESTFVGLPCTFVRLSGCNLRCSWCDTPQAFTGGTRMARSEVLAQALAHKTPLIEVTGGEPLLQPGTPALLTEICDAGKTALIETSGERDIGGLDPRVHRIVDFKAPGSGECERNRWENVAHLTARDEVKFVLADEADYLWAKARIEEYDLAERAGTVLLSPAWSLLDPKALVSWTLRDAIPARVQVQLHKYIWDADTQGV